MVGSSEGKGSSSSNGMSIADRIVDSLRHFARALASSPVEQKENTAEDIALLLDLAGQVRGLLDTDSEIDKMGNVLRAVLEALEAIKAAVCVVQFCRLALDLMQLKEPLAGVPVYHVQQAFLTISKALFRYSKDDINDGLFANERVIEPLLLLLTDTLGIVGKKESSALSHTAVQKVFGSARADKKVTNEIRIL
jgi:hypothetical protein